MNLMAKMDGLTASVVYRGGALVSAESRGNGEVGEDITHTARTFCNLPQKIPFRGELIVDGECIIDYPTFRRINQQEQTEYKNPRNLVSGTVRQLDSRVSAQRGVKFIAWKLYAASDEAGSPLDDTKTYSSAFALLEKLGFEVISVREEYPQKLLKYGIAQGYYTDFMIVALNRPGQASDEAVENMRRQEECSLYREEE